MDFPDKLMKALDSLDRKLSRQHLKLDLTVLGSMALYLSGYELDRQTDIDAHNKNLSPMVMDLISEVSNELGVARDWINNKASSIEPLPEGYESRLTIVGSYKNITLLVLSLEDIICLKVNAAYSRSLIKDIEDLKAINPTAYQLDKGIEYIENLIISHHGKSKLNKIKNELIEFRKELDEKLR